MLLAQIGQWQSHLPYNGGNHIAQSDDAVFIACRDAYVGQSLSILKVYKEDNSIERISKITGLSSMGVKWVSYNKTHKLLVIAYNDANIDLLYDNGTVVNLPAIIQNTTIVGDKSINHVYNYQDKIYFSCSFGLVEFDLDLLAFSQTVFTPSPVNTCTRLNDTLYIGLDNGIYEGVLDGRNLIDFAIWDHMTANLPNPYITTNILALQGKVYATVNDTVMQYSQGAWSHIAGYNEYKSTNFSKLYPSAVNGWGKAGHRFFTNQAEDRLIITNDSRIVYSLNLSNSNLGYEYYPKGNGYKVQGMVSDNEGNSWATGHTGMWKNKASFAPDGPNSITISDMHVDKDGTLWCTASPVNFIGYSFNRFGFYKYKENEWTNVRFDATRSDPDTFDLIRVTSHPTKDITYIGSFMSGLLEIDANDNMKLYTKENSTLLGVTGDTARIRIAGFAWDDKKNLWLTNSLTTAPLVVIQEDGTWKHFDISNFYSDELAGIAIDRNGYKWIQQITGNLSVFDEGDIDDNSDNRSMQISSLNSNLPSSGISSLVADKDGIIWVGTDDGIIIFNCSSNIFDDGCSGNKPVVNPDDFNGHLLEGQNIRSIVVDGANRKWIGTDNGVFLLSADGYEQLEYFTEENSPLFSNKIVTMEIDHSTGDLYIATENGLQSYRGEATRGTFDMNKKTVRVYPHPVRPDYSGPIAIKNLGENANVKITDISGRLVYETDALGGQAIWNGEDYTGRRASSGVYLVFVVTEDGNQKLVTKMVFLN
ncbi:MAG: regulator [Aureispira sp.]|nr:regulator [Aureispira sp.]